MDLRGAKRGRSQRPLHILNAVHLVLRTDAPLQKRRQYFLLELDGPLKSAGKVTFAYAAEVLGLVVVIHRRSERQPGLPLTYMLVRGDRQRVVQHRGTGEWVNQPVLRT